MTVTDTSSMTYARCRDSFSSMREMIYSFILSNPDCTQHMVRKEFGLTPNTVSGRFRELEKSGLIVKTGKVREPLADGLLVYRFTASDDAHLFTVTTGDFDFGEYPFDEVE
jgi:DNA-binding Lrp family transcriptional regulator